MNFCRHYTPLRIGCFLLILFSGLIPANAEHKNTVHYQVHGVRGAVQKNIEARLSILAKKYENSADFMREAPEQVLKAMQPYAFYKPAIKSRLVYAENNARLAIFDIAPGPKLTVSNINIIIEGPGKDEPFFQKLHTDFPLKVGDPLLIKKYNKGKQAFLDVAAAHGYIKSRMLTSQVRINLQHYSSEIIIRFDTGKQFYFGPVTFNKTPYDEDYLRRYVPFKLGDPFVTEQLTTLQDALSSSDQFKQINVLPEYNHIESQTVPILVNLTPQQRESYTLGAGYGTDTGARGTLGWNLLEVTPSGHKFQSLLQLSQVQSSLQGQYIIPGEKPTEEEYAIVASIFNLQYPGSKSNAAQLSGTYRTHRGDWQNAYSLNALYEHYTIEEDPSQNAHILYPSATWQYRHVENPIFSKNGYNITFTTQGAAKALASSVSFAQAEISGKWAKTFSATRSRLYLRSDLGITAVDNIDNLPPSLQFYAGGAQSVRGYSYQSLGPGDALVVGSVEWQQEIVHKWYFNTFYDMGNAFDPTDGTDLKRSTGGGVMWVTPIGPVRLYLAKSLDPDPEDSNTWHVVFSMGPDL